MNRIPQDPSGGGTSRHRSLHPGVLHGGTARIVAATGADFLIFDCEHSGWSTEALRTQVALARGAGLVAIVNSPGAQYEREGLLLDMGAMGLMVPHMRTADQCRDLVAATIPAAWAPRRRLRHRARRLQAGRHRCHDRGGQRGHPHHRQAQSSAQFLENIDAILDVPGIDAAMVTSFDLSLDLGIAGQLGHPEIRRAQEKLLRACELPGRSRRLPRSIRRTGLRLLAEGYRLIQYSWDVGLLQEGLRAGIAALRG